jgi:hypothetical protein
MRVLRCRARLADRRRARLANSQGSLVKSPDRILSIARCVVSIRSSTCCAVVIALRMQTRATANGTDGKHAVRQHLALCDDGGDERQRGPRATRKHLSISASIDGGSTSSTALRAFVVHLLAVVLIDDLARCEPSKLCSVEPPRSTPVGAGARQRPQHAAK